MINEDAIDLIQYYEGCDNVAAACPAHVSNGGTWPYLTIGYGHSGPDVKEGMRITTSQARDILTRDLANVETMARDLVRISLTDTQFGAVCAIAFNIKPGLFNHSRCLAKLNAGDFGTFNMADALADPIGPGLSGMAREWAEFRGVERRGGPIEHLRGLIKRRASELELFFTGRWSVPRDDKQPAQPVSSAAKVVQKLHPGMRDPVISDLHAALEAAGFPTTCQDAYTWVTAEAVKAFQAANGLKADGVYGEETAMALAALLNGRSA